MGGSKGISHLGFRESGFTLIHHKALCGHFPICKLGHMVSLSGLVTIREEKHCGRGILCCPWNPGPKGQPWPSSPSFPIVRSTPSRAG